MYSEVRATNLVKIDLAGNVVVGSDWPVNPAGFTVHAAIHDGIPGAHCVMHTHTTAGLAVACSKGGLSPSNFYSAQLYGKLAYHDFEGITVHADEGPRLVRNIGDKPAGILRNHCLLAWRQTLPRGVSHRRPGASEAGVWSCAPNCGPRRRASRRSRAFSVRRTSSSSPSRRQRWPMLPRR